MTVHIDNEHLMRILRGAPKPMTTDQVAALLHYDHSHASLSSRLSKLHAYGKITREFHKGYENGQHRRCSLWGPRA